MFAITLLENQRYRRRSAKRPFGIWLCLVLLSTKKDTERCSCECENNRQAAKFHEHPGRNGFEREYSSAGTYPQTKASYNGTGISVNIGLQWRGVTKQLCESVVERRSKCKEHN